MDGVKTNYNIADVIFMNRYAAEPWVVECEMMTPRERKLQRIGRHGISLRLKKIKVITPSTVDEI